MSEFSPPGWPLVIPRIATDDAEGLVHFVKDVFGASGDFNSSRPTELNLGGSMLMIAGIDVRGPFPAFLYVYIASVDDVYQRAIEMGATSIESPNKTPYGDRRCTIEDAWGNLWQIATRQP